MKALVKSYVWWPKIDIDIDGVAESCTSCLELSRNPKKTELVP